MPSNACMTIGFKGLKVLCLIGTLPHEKMVMQTLRISVAVVLKAIPQDSLEETLNYCTVVDICRKTCKERHRNLIETLARDILQALTMRFEMKHIKIIIEKPSALEDADCAFVEIEQDFAICAGR